MTRATKISRVVFVLLVLATGFAFFAAQRLKHSDSLVHAVSFKRYISPNDDGLREKGRVRFRLKQQDQVTVEVIDRTGETVRVLADHERLGPGPHTFYWNGRRRGVVDADGRRHRGLPVPDGAYRVRISLRERGRSFVPEQFFVVDTEPPEISAQVEGAHSHSVLRRRTPVPVRFGGAGGSMRAEFLVYRVVGGRTARKPVASFLSRRGSDRGFWLQTVGAFSRWQSQCQGIRRSGRARPAPTGSYVIVARACDAAGNVGSSSTLPPARGSTRGNAGVTLTGLQIAPALRPVARGTRISLPVAAPTGGWSWQIRELDGRRLASGRSRGKRLRARLPATDSGLLEVVVRARRPVAGDVRRVVTPLVPAPRSSERPGRLLLVQPTISWQALNPLDSDGDGFAEDFATTGDGRQLRVPLERMLARAAGPAGWRSNEAVLSRQLGSARKFAATTDLALAEDPHAVLEGRRAVFFTGDERWLTPQAGTALKKFVLDGGRVAFFTPQAFRRTVTIDGRELVGPSAVRARDVFGEATKSAHEQPAPLIAFTDELGLLRGPTGLFTSFEQSLALPREARALATAGRLRERPALVAYRLGKGLVVRVGVAGWGPALAAGSVNVAWTTAAALEVIER